MAWHDVLYTLEKMGTITEKRETAEHLFQFSHNVPNGFHNPGLFDSNMYFFGTDKGIIETISMEDNFFKTIISLYDEKPPKIITDSYDTFKKNLEHTQKLLSLEQKQRRCLPIHEFYPYCQNFNETIKGMYGYDSKDIISNLTFVPELIGKGAYGCVYKINEQYALKLFYPEFMTNWHDRRMNLFFRKLFYENISEQKTVQMGKPFVNIHAISHPGRDEFSLAYIMDYISGINAEKLYTGGRLKNPELLGRILLTYANMLATLHEQKKVFVDNSLDAILWDKKNNEIRVCDLDFITPIEKINQIFSNIEQLDRLDRFGFPYHRHYPSKEAVLLEKPTFEGDLEGFSMIIHKTIIGRPFLYQERFLLHEKEKAKANSREYKKDFMTKLPSSLKEIVPKFLTYPRNTNGITAKDFVLAIKKDYGF